MSSKSCCAISGFARTGSVFDALKTVRDAGFDGVDFSFSTYSSRAGEGLCSDAWWRQWVDAVKTYLSELSLPVLQAHAPWEQSIPKDLHYEAPFPVFSRSIEACALLGCRTLVFHPLVYPWRIESEDLFDRILDYNRRWFGEIVPVAARFGITVALENVFDYYHVQKQCHSEPVTDVTGVGVRSSLSFRTGDRVTGVGVPSSLSFRTSDRVTGVGIRIPNAGRTDCHANAAAQARNDRDGRTDCHDNAAALARNDSGCDPDYCFTTAAQMKALLAAIDAPNVGFCLDTGHANIAGQSVPDMLRTYGRDLKCLHLNDNFGRSNGLYEDVHLFPGEGTLPWDAIRAALREIGYDGVYDLELIADLKQLDPQARTERLRRGGEWLAAWK